MWFARTLALVLLISLLLPVASVGATEETTPSPSPAPTEAPLSMTLPISVDAQSVLLGSLRGLRTDAGDDGAVVRLARDANEVAHGAA